MRKAILTTLFCLGAACVHAQQPIEGVANGVPVPVSAPDGDVTTLGSKADAKSSATDTTAITAMQVLKELSYLLQNALSVNVGNGSSTGADDSANTTTKAAVLPCTEATANPSLTSGYQEPCSIDPNGNIRVELYPGTLAQGATSAMTGTSSTQVIAGVASNYLYITSCRVSNTSTTVGTLVDLQVGSGGSTIDVLPAPAAANSMVVEGAIITYPTPLKVTTAGDGLYAADVTTSASVIVSCNGFVSPVSY